MAMTLHRRQILALLFVAMLGVSEAIAVHQRVMLHTSLMFLLGRFGSVAGMRDTTVDSEEGGAEGVTHFNVESQRASCDNDFTVDIYSHHDEFLKQIRVYAGNYDNGHLIFKRIWTFPGEETRFSMYLLECKDSTAVLTESGSGQEATSLSFSWWYTVSFPNKVSQPEFASDIDVSDVKTEDVGFITLKPQPSTCQVSFGAADQAMETVKDITNKKVCVDGDCETSSLPVSQFAESLMSFGQHTGNLNAMSCRTVVPRHEALDGTVLRESMMQFAKEKYTKAHVDEEQGPARQRWEAVIKKIKELGCQDKACRPQPEVLEDLVLMLWEGPEAKIDEATRKDLNAQVAGFESLDDPDSISNPGTSNIVGMMETCLESKGENCHDIEEKVHEAEKQAASLLQLDRQGAHLGDLFMQIGALAVAGNVVFFGFALIIILVYFPVGFFIGVAVIAAVYTIIMAEMKKYSTSSGSSYKSRVRRGHRY